MPKAYDNDGRELVGDPSGDLPTTNYDKRDRKAEKEKARKAKETREIGGGAVA